MFVQGGYRLLESINPGARMKEMLISMISPDEALNQLAWFYHLRLSPLTEEPPQRTSFEEAFGCCLGQRDPALMECAASCLIFNRFEAERLVEYTPETYRPRLRMAVLAAQFLYDFDHSGLPHAIETYTALKKAELLLVSYSMANDPWGNPLADQMPGGTLTDYFLKVGLQAHWPLTDFVKQHEWTKHMFWLKRGPEQLNQRKATVGT
jgi:hypothetical protein